MPLPLAGWFAAHKKIGIAVIVLLVAGLCAGGYFGWQEYQRRQTSAFALEKLKEALKPVDTNALAHMVDFHAISRDLAKAARRTFPFLHDGHDPERSISHTIQTALLKRFLEKDSAGSQFPEDESPEALLKKPLEMLPKDFIDQLVSGSTLTVMDENSAQVTAKITNKQFKDPFTLRMLLQKGPDGWRIRHIVNAEALAGQLRQELLRRHVGLREVYEAKNRDTTKQMEEVLKLETCTAHAGVLSDKRTFLLMVHATAKNIGDVKITNFNLDTTLYGRDGQPVWHRFLNVAKPVAPGENFNNRWSYELEASDPIARQILAAGPLQCRAKWQTLTLGSGKVLHIAEVPNPAEQCATDGHNHPKGFCTLPLFQR